MVRWKKLINRKEIVQCHKCQKWGHAATNCYAAAECLKCANNHLISECTLKKDAEEDQRKIKCANCSQGHLVNGTDCEKYQQKKNVVERNRTAAAEKRNKQNKTYIPAPSPAINPWTQRTQAVQSSDPRTERNPAPTPAHGEHQEEANYGDFVKLMQEIRKLNPIINIKKILEIVAELTLKQKNCSFQQIQTIFEVSNKISNLNGP
jgi:hypothetical protein